MSDEHRDDDAPGDGKPHRRPTTSQPLAEKVAGLQGIRSPGMEKIARVLKDVQSESAKSAGIAAAMEQSKGISKAAEAMSNSIKMRPSVFPEIKPVAPLFPRVPEFDMSDLTSAIDELEEIDWTNTPDARAARAAEKTAEHLEVLVEEAVDGRIRSLEAERREVVMLRWTVAGVVLAAIAAVASIIAIAVG